MGTDGSDPQSRAVLVSLVEVIAGSRSRRVALGVPIASAAVLVVVAFHRPWVHEDAFLTMRTVDQFVHGNGLRWNIDERVQTYTHPLWMLANIPLYYFVRDYPSTVSPHYS